MGKKVINQQVIGRLHSVETMGLVDGPGIRTIFFLQGCPLRCLYCHNPDTQEFNSGKEITPQDILKYAKRYLPYQGEDGGVTFSGGEPLAQGEFLAASLQLLKENRINTCVDTSGFGQKKYYPEIFPYVDTLLLDVKAFNDSAFQEMCQVGRAPFIEFIQNLESYGFHGQIWIRHVMVPGFTDNQKAMDDLVKTLMPIQHLIERLEILPYHTAGITKYQELNRPYLLENVEPMNAERAKEFEKYANIQLIKQISQTRTFKQELKDLKSEISAIDQQKNTFPVIPNYSRQQDPISDKQSKDSTITISAEHTESVQQMSTISKQEQADLKIKENFGKLPLLKHLNKQVLSDMQDRLIIMHLRKDDILFKTGDKPNYMYIICSGAVKIYTHLPNNKEQILYIYRRNDFVGGHNLLENKSYWYIGQAIDETIIVAIPKIIFEAYLIDKKVILKQILSQSFNRIRWAEDLINRLATMNSSVKTAGLLLHLADTIGTKHKDGSILIPLEIERGELSNFSGLTRETLSRKLGEFEELGYLKIENEKMTILNPKALASYLD